MSAKMIWSSRSRSRRNHDAFRFGREKEWVWMVVSVVLGELGGRAVSVRWVSVWSVGSGIVFEHGGGGTRRLRAGLDIGFQRRCK